MTADDDTHAADAGAALPFGASPLAFALRHLLAASADTRPALAQRMGLSLTETWAVEHLMAEPMGPVDLSRRLGITSAAATVLVRRLEQTGHVARAPHATDRRRVVLHPTASAQQSVAHALGPLLGGLEEAAAGLSDEQREMVAQYLERAAQVVEAFTRPGAGRG